MNEYVVFLKNGHALTIRAGCFTKTSYEVLFYEGGLETYRSATPR